MGEALTWFGPADRHVGDFVKINKFMNKEKYHRSLIHGAVQSGKHLIGNSFIFQHESETLPMQ